MNKSDAVLPESVKKCAIADDIEIEIVRKKVKHFNLTVLPPDGRVKISVPYHSKNETVVQFAKSKINWIRKQQEKIMARHNYQPLTYHTGELHWYNGDPVRLRVLESNHPGVRMGEGRTLEMRIKPGTDNEKREKLLKEWYRRKLKEQIPPLLEKWERITGVKANEWGVKQMKTRWGTCQIRDKRIWVNLALVKYPVDCLEYLLLHELVHLLERGHNARFYGMLDQYMPDWRERREKLRTQPMVPTELEGHFSDTMTIVKTNNLCNR